MKRFLLLHGSWHGAWCWFKVAPRLRAHGEVVVLDLPGRGRVPAWAPTVTLGRMVRALRPSLEGPERATVVAHSRYGALATALAEAYPERVERVIYVASYALPSGHRVVDHFARDVRAFIRPFVRVSRLGGWDELDRRAWVEGLYADCSPDDVALASSLLCREPSLPALARVRTTGERFGRVAKGYVRLSEDRAVSPDAQDAMIAAAGIERVESVAASHSAYFSRPDELTRAILALGGS